MSDNTARKVKTTDFLDAHGLSLLEQGYNIIPIAVGTKAPPFDNWQKMRATSGKVESWINEGMGRFGVGIITTNTPAIDIDVEDDLVAQEVEDWIVANIGAAPTRYGNGSKRLLLYRTEEPFSKVMTNKFIGEFNAEMKIEVLAEGQQFVAYAIHPDTNMPYTWTTEDEPLNTRAKDLPLLTRKQAEDLCNWFTKYCHERKFKLTGRAGLAHSRRAGQVVDRDNPFIEDSPPVDMTTEELRERLSMIADNNDHDQWFQVGMALYHQYDGDDEGLALWDEWSRSSSKYDQKDLEYRWKTFNVDGKGRAPLTAAFILKLANEAEAEQADAERQKLVTMFAQAQAQVDIVKAVKLARVAEIDKNARILVSDALRKAWSRIHDGSTLPKTDARRMIEFRPDNSHVPEWLNEWVFDAPADKFFSTRSKIHLTASAFDAVNNRKAYTKEDKLNGLDGPSRRASDLAINKYRIPTVVGVRYMPGQEHIFEEDGDIYANSYSERGIPVMPKVSEMLPRDKKAIQRVVRHFRHLLNEDEAVMLMDYLAYIVQNPGEKITYSVLLQGVEGDGKSFFAMLLRAIIGSHNARILNAGILESQFTGWAEGQCFVCIEEVRLLSHNRYDLMNAIKPFASNKIVNVHPKGREPYDITNTSNYLLLTNFQDAMPLSKDDRRYLVLFSLWQTKEALMEFMKNEPNYYADLYEAIEVSAGALRRHFMDHELSPDFDPRGPAPITAARSRMIHQARSDFIRAMTDIIENSNEMGLSTDLLNMTRLQQILMDLDVDLPDGRALNNELNREGFHRLGRILIGKERAQIWSANPGKWTFDDGRPKANDIRKVLTPLPPVTDLDDEQL